MCISVICWDIYNMWELSMNTPSPLSTNLSLSRVCWDLKRIGTYLTDLRLSLVLSLAETWLSLHVEPWVPSGLPGTDLAWVLGRVAWPYSWPVEIFYTVLLSPLPRWSPARKENKQVSWLIKWNSAGSTCLSQYRLVDTRHKLHTCLTKWNKGYLVINLMEILSTSMEGCHKE